MYKLTNYETIIRLSDNVSIPKSEENMDYVEYLAWVSDGNTPEQADSIIPQTEAEEQMEAEKEVGVTDAAWLDALKEQAISGETTKIDALKDKLDTIIVAVEK